MAKKFWNVKNESETAEILIYGQISDESWFEDEITPKQFATDLQSFDGKDLTVRINSLGGDVFAAQAIHNQLKDYSGKVSVKIDGICASAATIIACAGDTVSMPNNCIFMIHNPSTILIGSYDAPYLEKVGNALNTIKQTIINVYLNKTDKLNAKKLSKFMDEEKNMTADEALEYGFIDEICGKPAKIENKNGQIYINSLMIDTRKLKNSAEFMKIINRKVEKLEDKTVIQKFWNWLKTENKVKNDDETGEKDEKNGNISDNDNPAENKKAANSAKNAILAEDRKRISALIALKTGNSAIDKFIDVAIVQGDSVEKVKAYVESLKEAAPPQNKGTQELNNFVKDNMTSGAEDIKGSGGDDNNNEAAKDAAIDDIAKYMNQIRGVK